jgi:predicted metalloprotease
MRWRNARRSTNIEDRRGAKPRGRALGGGLGTLLIILAAWYFGVDVRPLLSALDGSQVATNGTRPTADELSGDPVAARVAVVMADTEDAWHALFRASGLSYREPTLVMFTGATQSACGRGQAAMGPFYCPADEKAYIDLSFFRDLEARFGAPGDFAQAYVIAHEVGHHVQNLLGTSTEVRRRQAQLNQSGANELSVRLELQADCYAGIWAHHADKARQLLEAGDIDEALNAASAIGDDRLQRQSQGRVVPESFTHGTSAQRQRWFSRGYHSGDPADCDTFASAP